MFNGPLSGTTQVNWYQKGKTNLDFTEARDSEWQWHQLGHMQVCTSLQTDNHANTLPLSFLQARCPSCHPTNSVKALKGISIYHIDATSQNLVKMFLEFLKIKIRLQFLCSCLSRQFTVTDSQCHPDKTRRISLAYAVMMSLKQMWSDEAPDTRHRALYRPDTCPVCVTTIIIYLFITPKGSIT